MLKASNMIEERPESMAMEHSLEEGEIVCVRSACRGVWPLSVTKENELDQLSVTPR